MKKKIFLEGICIIFFLVLLSFVFTLNINFVSSASVGETCEDVGEVDAVNDLYCSVDGTWQNLKALNSVCDNDFECVNGECNEGVCQSKFTPIVENTGIIEQIKNFIFSKECVSGEHKCEGERYVYCGENGAWDDGALVDGKCGYSSPTPPGPGGGNGGGGGSPSCNPNWNCTAWTNPSQFCGTRTCVDLNNCGTTINRPLLSKSCPGNSPFCGDGYCDPNEDFNNCPSDCKTINLNCNNNGVCEPDLGEHSGNCPNDCKPKNPGIPDWLFWVLIAILVSAILFVLFLLYRRYKRNKQSESFSMKKFTPKTPPIDKSNDKEKIEKPVIENKEIPKLDENLGEKEVNKEIKEVPKIEEKKELIKEKQPVKVMQPKQIQSTPQVKKPIFQRFIQPRFNQQVQMQKQIPKPVVKQPTIKPVEREKVVYQTDNVFPNQYTNAHARAVSNIASTKNDLRDRSEFSLKSYLEKRRRQEVVDARKREKSSKAKIIKGRERKKSVKKKAKKKSSSRKPRTSTTKKIVETKTTIKREIHTPSKKSTKRTKKSSKKKTSSRKKK